MSWHSTRENDNYEYDKSPHSNASIASDLNFSEIDTQVKQRQRGHVTLASIKVVSLIGAWVSVILLGFVIAGVIIVATFMPEDIGTTLDNGLLFMKSVNDGYLLALQNMKPSPQQSSSFSEAVSQNIQAFYEIPFSIIRQKFNNNTMEDLLPILSKIPEFKYDAQDLIWFISAQLWDVFTFTIPRDFIFNSERNVPYTCVYNDRSNPNDELNGEFIDESVMFPGIYKKLFKVNNSDNIHSHNLIRVIDNYWVLHQSKAVTNSIGEVQIHSTLHANDFINSKQHLPNTMILNPSNIYYDISQQGMILNVKAIEFYNAISNKIIIFHKTGHQIFKYKHSNKWLFYYDESISSQWILAYKENNFSTPQIVRTYNHIAPISYNYVTPRIYSSFHIQSIEVTVPDSSEFNGIYYKSTQLQYWMKYMLFNADDTLNSATTYIRTVNTNNNNNSYFVYELSHQHINNHNKWILKSYHIQKLFESEQSVDITSSIGNVRWKKLNQSTNTMELYKDLEITEIKTNNNIFNGQSNTKQIIKIILHYQKQNKKANNIIHTALCHPSLVIKDELLYLKLSTTSIMKDVNNILIKLKHVNAEHKCIKMRSRDTNIKRAYLKLESLHISSEILGGEMIGFSDVFFSNIQSCQYWRNLLIKTQKKNAFDSGKTVKKNEYKLCKDIAKRGYTSGPWKLIIGQILKLIPCDDELVKMYQNKLN